MKIKQIEKDKVLDTLCNYGTVYRFDAEKVEVKNLKTMSINRIVEALGKDNYIYFTLEVSE